MAVYGDIATVKGMLRPNETSSFGTDADARLTALQLLVSRQIEQRTNGRIFGGTATATARTVDGEFRNASDILMLPMPVRSVTSVAIVGDAAETLDSTDWALWYPVELGDYYAIKRLRGISWPLRDGVNRMTVTAVWSNTANGGSVPDDITYSANRLIAEIFKAEQASPAGFTGPDGSVMPVRNPWKIDEVAAAIAYWKIDLKFLAF